MRLIDADALELETLYESCETYDYNDCYREVYEPVQGIREEDIEKAPTIDAVPVVYGHWESTSGYDRCSVCKGLELGQTKYCPHCGARMWNE